MEEVTFLPCVASPMTAKDIIISSHGCWDLFSSVVEIPPSLNAIAEVNSFYYKMTAEFRRRFAFSKTSRQKQVSKRPVEGMVLGWRISHSPQWGNRHDKMIKGFRVKLPGTKPHFYCLQMMGLGEVT